MHTQYNKYTYDNNTHNSVKAPKKGSSFTVFL